MSIQYCEFVKKDGTKCKNFAQPEHKYCQVHLKTIDLQDNIDGEPTSTGKPRKFDLFWGVFSIVVDIGIIWWTFQRLWAQLSYIQSYYFLGLNAVVIWLYRILLVFRYTTTSLIFILYFAGLFSSNETKEKKLYRASYMCAFLLPPLIGAQNFIQYSSQDGTP